jgi:demethylmenaquinone methyltransferase/2-methoxy-6-polyprenyl-1,4-benzoquinol methylase
MRTKVEAQRSYDRLSRWYDLFSGTGELKLVIKTLDLMTLPVGGTILEVGFGTGKLLLELIRRVGEHGRVYGVDLSPGMCHFTKKRLNEAGMLDRVVLTVGDGYRLPIADDRVDAVFMGFTLELFDTPELVPVIQECLRIMKPGGQLGIVTLSVSSRPGFAERLYTKAHAYWPRLVDCRPIDPGSLLVELVESGFSSANVINKKLWGLSVVQLVLVKMR